MKKIMFNDRFGLTQAVLDGRKTQTRRLASRFLPDAVRIGYARFEIANGRELRCWTKGTSFIKFNLPYKVGEVVAVAESYGNCGGLNEQGLPRWDVISQTVGSTNAGWDNKMFVRANLMPHKIRITNVRIERLQEISDEDCLKEGIYPYYYGDEEEKKFYEIPPNGYTFYGTDYHYPTPREAFAHLINEVSGKGTWERNPYVFVYDFELVKP